MLAPQTGIGGQHMRTALTWAMGACALGATLSSGALAQSAGELSGAYVGPGQSCEDIFVTRNGKTSFKAPRNAFSSAILIQGGRLSTPLATCKIGRSSRDKAVITLNLNCTNALSPEGVKAYVLRRDDGALVRLSGPNETGGETYERCGR